MLNGPALLRVLLVVIAAATLTGLVQRYWLFESSPPDTPAVVARPAPPATQARSSAPPPLAPQPAPALQAAPALRPATPMAGSAAAAPSESRSGALAPPVSPELQPVRPLPQRTPAPVAAEPETGEQESAAAEAADPPAVGLIDLNTGSLQALNGLRGGGAIGRAIVQHRPYASTDQLLSKRVLSRAIYQRIKGQVTVR